MKKSQYMDDDLRMLVALHHTTNALVRATEKELSQHGLTYMQTALLLTVQSIGERSTPAEISRWLFREPHSVSGLINRMEKAGLVKKVKDLERKNLVRVAITEKGMKTYSRAVKWESIHNIMSTLSEEERKALRGTLKKIRERALKEMGFDRRTRLARYPLK